MLKRIISSLIGLPALIFVVATGGIVLQSGILALVLIGMHELYATVSKKTLPVHLIGYGFAAVYGLLLPNLTENAVIMLFTVFTLAMLVSMVWFHETTNIIDISVTFFGFFYIAFLMYFIFLVRSHTYGQYLVWLIFISAWGSDTFAYFTGLTMGRHKLCPKLSPKKTIEGAVGGVVGATLLAVIYALLITKFEPRQDFDLVLYFGVICAICAVFSQIGDLSASAIKRTTGIKDFGSIIPGHGGILDRFDSLLFTSPGVYLVVFLLLKN